MNINSKVFLEGKRKAFRQRSRISRNGGTMIASKSNEMKNARYADSVNLLEFDGETVDLVEEMLFQRAASGIRPVLYLSSYTDLECSMLMLLDDTGEALWSAEQTPAVRQTGYHIITN